MMMETSRAVVITSHAALRFVERVAPCFTLARAHAYLTQLTVPYSQYQGFDGRCCVDSRFGPLVLDKVMVVSVWPPRSGCPARRLTA